MKQKFHVSSLIVVFDSLTHDQIQKNVVLKDAIDFVGGELYVSNGKINPIIRKINITISLIRLLLKFIKGVKILHFGALDVKPLKLFGILFKKNVYLFQSDSFRHTYGKYDQYLGMSPQYCYPIGKNIVAFNDLMPQLVLFKNKDKKIFNFGETRTRQSWVDYSMLRSNYYFRHYHANVDISKGYVVYILGYFGDLKQMSSPKSMVDLFKKTICILSELNIPVFIKPHVFTDINIVNKAIEGHDKLNISYLHPTVLTSNAVCFICNGYSTIMADAYSFGITTIEYTDYNTGLLLRSENKSLGYEYIDYFINNDIALFKETITHILFDGYKINNYNGHTGDSSGLLYQLSQ